MAGFIIPKPRVPGWWIWLLYLNPAHWSFYVSLFPFKTPKSVHLKFPQFTIGEVHLRIDLNCFYRMPGKEGRKGGEE